MTMRMLAIDTSTSAITVSIQGGPDWATASVLDARGHAEHVAPLLERVLAQAGLDPADVTDVVVGNGPGPFTGLRVGIVTGLVFAHARGIPVHGVCSLDALAQDAAGQVGGGEFVVATDARRKEVYWARYAGGPGSVRRLTDPAVDRPGDLPEEVRRLPTAGRGPVLYADLFPTPVAVLDVSAGSLGRLAQERLAAGETLAVEPMYLRRPEALTTAERGARA
jgi:tRNA threonylcarbamoyladenosine biosynthesis protein TsaB